MKKIILKGFFEPLILAILQKESLHGYALMKKIEELIYIKPSPGTLYPLLRKLEVRGFVKKRKVGRRIVYTLTKKGLRKVETLKKLRKEFRKTLMEIAGEDLIRELRFFKNKTIREFIPLIKKHVLLIYNKILEGKKEMVKEEIVKFNKKLSKI